MGTTSVSINGKALLLLEIICWLNFKFKIESDFIIEDFKLL